MTEDLGMPIAVGRTADVYAWQPGWVVKLFREGVNATDVTYEAQVARSVQTAGLPVPVVGKLVQVNGRQGLIYQRVEGSTMLARLGRQPWRFYELARHMAALQARVHRVAGLTAVPDQRQKLSAKISAASASSAAQQSRILNALSALPPGQQLCHNDFHPDNILLTADGAFIIDWLDATLGNPLADVARTSIILLGAAASSQVPRAWEKMFVRLFHAVYLRHYFKIYPDGAAEYRRWLPIVAAARLSENIPEVESWLLATCAA